MKIPTRLLATLLSLLGLLAGACTGSSNEEEMAQLRAENEALKARESRQVEEEELALATAELDAAKKDLTEDLDAWAWADASGEPASPELSEPPRPVEPQPRPRQASPRPRPEPAPDPEPVPELEPAPTNLLSKPTAAAPTPQPLPEPVYREASHGALLTMTLDSALDSGQNQVGDRITARLASDVRDERGDVVLPAGTELRGTITEATAARKLKRKSALAFHFDEAVLPDGRSVAVSAGRAMEGEGYTKRDGAIIGGSAAGGALLGQLLGGDSEATAVGAILGGAIGSGVRLGKKGEDIVLPEGTELELSLEQSIRVEQPAG